jgi:hypothetical protein
MSYYHRVLYAVGKNLEKKAKDFIFFKFMFSQRVWKADRTVDC